MKTKKSLFLVIVITALSLAQLAYGQALPADPPVPDPALPLPAFLFDPAPLPVPAVQVPIVSLTITNPPPVDPLTNAVASSVVAPPVVNTNPPPVAVPPPPVVVAVVSNTTPTVTVASNAVVAVSAPIVATNLPPATLVASNTPPTGVALSSLTQADLEALAKFLQASLTRPTPTPSLERFVRSPQTNKIVVNAKWETSFGDGRYEETRIIEAGTAGAQQAVPEVPSVAELVSALTTARVAQQALVAPATKVAAGVSAAPQVQSQGAAQVARNEPAQPQASGQHSAFASAPKNPVILQDGKLSELPGQWLFTKDGTPVFVPKAPPQQEPSVAATEPDEQDEERPFTLLVPAGGNAPDPQYVGDGSGSGVSNAVYPSGRSGTYGRGLRSYRATGRRSQIGINSEGFPILLGSGVNRGDTGKNSQGFPTLLRSGQY